jgi:hypothetical protein
MRHDIPINISVIANTESRAEVLVFDFLKKALKEFGAECSIVDFEYFEFIGNEDSNV